MSVQDRAESIAVWAAASRLRLAAIALVWFAILLGCGALVAAVLVLGKHEAGAAAGIVAGAGLMVSVLVLLGLWAQTYAQELLERDQLSPAGSGDRVPDQPIRNSALRKSTTHQRRGGLRHPSR
jgi:hypothetical protein